MKWTLLHRMAAGVIACSMAISPALAQKSGDEPMAPFDVPGLPNTRIWVPWVFAFMFVAACIAIAFKNPHRTHLD